jgi:thioredoxin reductase (NADPH)
MRKWVLTTVTTASSHDAVVIGAGPTGLACALELSRAGYDYRVLEKGALVNSLFHFPPNMVYFTTPELLEIGDMPLVTTNEKPTRLEALKYYRKVTEACALNVQTYERVLAVRKEGETFVLSTEVARTGEHRTYNSRAVIVATGYYDNPKRMGIPGEDLAKVSHYYTESHAFAGREVMVIGAANSAAEAALDLFRGGARVTLVHRRAEPSKHLKYWVGPDLANRIKAGEIQALFETEAVEIRRDSVVTRHVPTGELREVPNDFVFALTGYRADAAFLRSMGITLDPRTEKPALDPDTLESNVPGLYVAGVAIAGLENHNVFIENGRFHGKQIVRALRARMPPSGRPVLAPATEP